MMANGRLFALVGLCCLLSAPALAQIDTGSIGDGVADGVGSQGLIVATILGFNAVIYVTFTIVRRVQKVNL